ncbi:MULTISPECIES: nuclear transport factor 2 family protein [unclassified Beijerinckia]|uniref:nuclear transport factor 2 family protein n=1 Tax=unclassified Beijerinckia TaxID=2638183 RepID=UPI0008984008|nr:MULTISPECIES: nuclear transport factor 2 family protein [unclassified Beijerinckia]MDH7795302.1 hypothetical protein [Beijerinckia sp. GAS462]SEB95932.1 SnoaL-like domain-containing protein [Beijerinckia sp. 28-YEA-48]
MTQDNANWLATEWDCQKLLLAFYQAIDEARFKDVAGFFAPDGEWHRAGAVVRGPAAVERIYEGRSTDTRARHIITNLVTTAKGVDTASFSLCITFYTGPGGKTAPTISGPSMVLSSHGELVRIDGNWRIRRKETIREFMVAPAAG